MRGNVASALPPYIENVSGESMDERGAPSPLDWADDRRPPKHVGNVRARPHVGWPHLLSANLATDGKRFVGRDQLPP